jgi:glycosyltransferase involved in cell wall biosynthesis
VSDRRVLEVDQFLPSLTYGDAVGNHVLRLKETLGAKVQSGVFFENCEARLSNEGHYYWEYGERQAHRESSLLYHLSIGSPIAEYILTRDEPLYIDYHDFTPPEYFAPYDPVSAELVEEGHYQMKCLTDRATMAWAHSEFARQDLEKAGYENTRVLPVFMDFSRFDRAPDSRTLRKLRETKTGGPDILFVGRVAPNKFQQDLIKLVRFYTELFERPARLFCVGIVGSEHDRYAAVLRELARDLGVADQIELTGAVSMSQLRAYYASCDVFVSMSDHEGFGVPLLESMYMGLPVVAYGAAAVPETVGSGGIVLERRDFVEFAVTVERIFTDESVRRGLIEAGRKRLTDFDPQLVTARYLEHLLPAL